MERAEILKTASEYVCKDREDTYGKPEDNFQIVADFWSTYLNAGSGEYDMKIALSAEDVANMMSLLKIARIATGKAKEDNYIDLAGYAACAGEIATSRSE